MKQNAAKALVAARYADWGQVIANGGPPCFHLTGMTFCLRAERWVGHEFAGEGGHEFVSLHDLLKDVTTTGRKP